MQRAALGGGPACPCWLLVLTGDSCPPAAGPWGFACSQFPLATGPSFLDSCHQLSQCTIFFLLVSSPLCLRSAPRPRWTSNPAGSFIIVCSFLLRVCGVGKGGLKQCSFLPPSLPGGSQTVPATVAETGRESRRFYTWRGLADQRSGEGLHFPL